MMGKWYQGLQGKHGRDHSVPGAGNGELTGVEHAARKNLQSLEAMGSCFRLDHPEEPTAFLHMAALRNPEVLEHTVHRDILKFPH